MSISSVKRLRRAPHGGFQPRLLLLLLAAAGGGGGFCVAFSRARLFRRELSTQLPVAPTIVSYDSANATSPNSFPPPPLPVAGNSSRLRANGEQNRQRATPNSSNPGDPYHDWELFRLEFEAMLKSLRFFVYPDVSDDSSPFARVFLPHSDPFHPKLGNYFSEHMFKINLLRSPFVTTNPDEAHLFFMPFSINSLRNDPRVHSESSIADFVARYTDNISGKFSFWNASKGSDHFYAYCHSVGRSAAEKHQGLQINAIQVTCSSSYFQRLFVAHKDVSLPQVWPRQKEKKLVLPEARAAK